MSDLVEYRTRLEKAHRQMQTAMAELIERKDYAEAERLLRLADKEMVDLISDMGGLVVRE